MSVKEKIQKYEETDKASPKEEASSDHETVMVEIEKDSVESLQAKVDAALADSQQHYDRLLRVSAEFDNFKKRTSRDMDEFRKFANESILRELLHVVDNLERAVASVGGGSGAGNSILDGVKMTLTEILKIFSRFGVTPIDSVGRMFDPAFHQAIMQEETNDHPQHTVLKEMQKGYLLYERLLRPAMVVVAEKLPSASDAKEAPAETKTEKDE